MFFRVAILSLKYCAKNKNISYINNAYSEYVGSNIFKLSNFETQNTILGKYNYNGKEKRELEKINKTELKNLAINCYSCLKENGKKINCMSEIRKVLYKEIINKRYNILKEVYDVLQK